MDEKSTPIDSLNNRSDDSEVVNEILSKYNNLQDGQTTIYPPNNIQNMENQFENRNLNKEIYDINSNNDAYQEHYQKEIERTKVNNQQYTQQNTQEDYGDDEEYEEYEEYEVIELPLWKKILNEIRIPFFIFIFILIFYNCTFDKFLLSKIPVLGNQFNECNTYGFLLKTFLISIISYIFIRFIRF